MAFSEFNWEIGGRIAEARRKIGFTQQELAEMIDVSVQFISAVERGINGVRISTLAKICKSLETSADFILFGIEEEPEEERDNIIKLAAMLAEKPLRIKERTYITDVLISLLKFFS